MLLVQLPLYGQEKHYDSTHRVMQKDLVDIVLNITKWETKKKARDTRKVNFSIIPLAAGTGANGQVAVSSFNAAFYLGDAANTNLSNIYLIPYTNLKDQGGFIIRPALWLSENKWNFTSELRLAGNSLNTYGLGSGSSDQPESVVHHSHARVYINANRLLFGHLYVGIGYNTDRFYNVSEQVNESQPTDFSRYAIGTSGSTTSSGFTFNLLRDARKNSINPDGGIYTSLIYKVNTPSLGSTYSWTSLLLDSRKYFSFSTERHKVLALWAFYWGTFGDVPYLNLPGTRLDLYARSGRGYAYGRFRGKQMIYSEAEYRFDISANGLWGGVVFANAQSVTEYSSGNFQYIKPAAGMGLRLKFNKKSAMNITMDVAVGKDSYFVYLNLGEFF